jgi:hypothetical protein
VYKIVVARRRQISKLSRIRKENVKVHHKEINYEVMDSDKMSGVTKINFFKKCLNLFYCTGLFEMIVGVLTTCHTQYTSDSSM